MKSNRLLRVGEEMLKELSQILNFEFEEYRQKFITVTEVRVTKDLQFADVWVSIMAEEKIQKKLIGQLITDAYRFRKALAGRIYLRHLPELRFNLDRTLDEAAKIDHVLATTVRLKVTEEENDPGIQ